MPISRTYGISMLLVALLLCASAAQSVAQTYNVADLGTLPGNSVSKAYAVNNAGGAAGTSSNPTGAIAVMFSSGTATSISTLGSDVSVATAISGTAEIAGYNIFYSNPNSEFQAFVYSNGSMKNINSASLFPSGTAAWGVNNSGQVVGTGYLNSSSFHAFLYSGGKMVDLGPRGAYQASAVAINKAG